MSHRGRRPPGRRRVALWCAVAAAGVILGACGSAAPPATTPPVTAVPAVGGTVAVGIDQAPSGCNPNTASGDTAADRFVLSAVLPSAFTATPEDASIYDPGGSAGALLVQAELQSTNPETVVYTINPRAVWSDGVPITASDFIYAWQHQHAVPLVGSGEDTDVASTAGYADIGSMTPSNHGRTLTVVFSTPYADWQSLFGDLLPAHVLEKTGWSPACHNVDPAIDLSGSAYEIATVSPRTIVLVRNRRWWGPPPKVARIVIRIATGSEQLAQWLDHGVIDVSIPSSFDPGYLTDVTSMPSTKSEVDISDTFLELEFNTASGATSNLLVREAIAYGIDRSELIDHAVAWADVNIAPATSHLYAQSQSAYPNTPAPEPANATTTTTTAPTIDTAPITAATLPGGGDPLAGARALVQAGYVRGVSGVWTDDAGHPLALRLAVDTADGWAAETALLLAAQLHQQGYSVTTVGEPSATAAGQALTAGQADLALLPLHATPYPSEAAAWYTPLLDILGGAGDEDWSGYASAKVDNLFNQAAAEFDPVTAQPLYDEIDQQLWSDMVALPLFAEPTSLAWSDKLSGIVTGPNTGALFSTVSEWALLVDEPVNYHGTPKIGSG